MKEFDLDKHPKIQSGFKTPEHYFDDLSAKVMARLPKQETKVVSLSNRRKSWMYAAAAVLVLALTLPVYKVFKKPVATLDQSSIENYLTNHAALTENDFAELLDEQDLQNIKIDSGIEDKTIEDLLSTNTELEDYLIN